MKYMACVFKNILTDEVIARYVYNMSITAICQDHSMSPLDHKNYFYIEAYKKFDEDYSSCISYKCSIGDVDYKAINAESNGDKPYEFIEPPSSHFACYSSEAHDSFTRKSDAYTDLSNLYD